MRVFACGRLGREPARAGLERQPQTVHEIAHRPVGARQHEQLQDGLVAVVRGQLGTDFVVDRAVLLQVVTENLASSTTTLVGTG